MARILLIDDDPSVQESLQLVIEAYGHTVSLADNGKLGIQTLKNDGPYDLVITDVVMPEKDGIEVLTEIRSTYPSLKVIVISGGGRVNAKNYLDVADVIGANAVLEKPVSNADLMACIENLL